MANTVAIALQLETTQVEAETVNVPMMPLHKLLACCYKHHRHAFAKRFAGSDGAIMTLFVWKGVEPNNPKLMAWAPALAQKHTYKTHCIPLALHGDGVPVFNRKRLYVINAVSLFGHWRQH